MEFEIDMSLLSTLDLVEKEYGLSVAIGSTSFPDIIPRGKALNHLSHPMCNP